MIITCKCGFEQTFQSKEDRVDYHRAGWVIYGFSLNSNSYDWICIKCQKKLSDNVKKILNIK